MDKLKVNQYYKRSGDSARLMEPFDIADMFGRRPRPKLVLSGTIKDTGIGNNKGRVYLVVTIANEGRGTARAPSIRSETAGKVSADDEARAKLPAPSEGVGRFVPAGVSRGAPEWAPRLK